MIKLAIINGWDEECFKYVKEKGLSAVEFCYNNGRDSKELLSKTDEINSYIKKYGVEVCSIGRWGMERVDKNGDIIPEAMEHDKNLIDVASAVGCPVYNVGCNKANEELSLYENCRFAINYFKELLRYGKERNVKIAVYNCDWSNFVYNPETWGIILGELPELGIKYDTSHCINRGDNYLAEMSKWANRFYHFHIKGNLRIGKDTYDDSPAGLDTTNWGAVMSILYINNYNGAASIEPHSRNWQGGKGQWGIDFTIDYMKKYIMPEKYEKMEVSPYMP